MNLICDIKLSTINGNSNNTFGNLYFYFTSANFQSPNQVGFYAITFLPPWGSETKYTSYLYSVPITLNKSNFSSTGGTFYAEFKNNNNSIYKSTIYTILNTTAGSNPGNGSNPLLRPIEEVPYGGVPILAELPLEDSWWYYKWVNSQYGNTSVINYDDKIIEDNWPLYDLKNIGLVHPVPFDKITNQQVFYTNFYPASFQLSVSRCFRWDDTSVPGTISYYKAIAVNNIISTSDNLIPINSNPMEIVGNQADVRRISYNGVTDSIVINNYQWQKRIYRPHIQPLINTYYNYKWENIPNATSSNYTPPGPGLTGTKSTQKDLIVYRRLINQIDRFGYLIGSASSNEVMIYPISTSPSINNTICCSVDYYLGNQTNSIIGSEPVTELNIDGSHKKFKYMWQRGTFRNGILFWNNIEDSNLKDFKPAKLSGRRSTEVHQYRRFVITEDYNYYLSESVEIKWFYQNAPNSGWKIKTKNDIQEEVQIIISPNPTSSAINISSEINLSAYDIKVIDMSGKTVLLRKPNINEINSIEINLASLPTGTYSIILENNFHKIIKKVIKQ